MKRLRYPLLSLAAPLLIVLAMLGLMHRQGSDRLQSLPAVLVGAGLIVSGAVGRRRRRRKLLVALRSTQTEEH
ncbi:MULTISPECIES: DUF3188 domain-containing protein [unclassified Prochlorococcus]|uniref:DUF3188 domain-containing protein n=1 Tax=unclassified Prochlorococcus TaxID=2627481 RepID=UPI0005339CA3|nr:MULTISPECIES: DUF3188 domain-containing protein [unclassified Prochlorococcus]KGG26290.1 hypothetical protein EV12_1853 [Prochlorococcus sp. MIT 0701]KGG30479.1 hypothetical protein EV13_0242 [Prochlorococcus sp. MIT 0702]KGG33984.1 hypothetical protein EV14_1524 [Prochlorococcus sp. MIT 0703]